MRIYTPQQMAAAEKNAEYFGMTLANLMENAGLTLANVIKHRGKEYNSDNILILAGNGNNGGDGFVCGEILHSSGFNVTCCLCCGEPKTQLAINAFSKLSDVKTITPNDDCFQDEIDKSQIIIDCIFGTGFHGEPSDDIIKVFKAVNKAKTYVVACDIPSGVNALTGECSAHTICCDETVAFHAAKLGLLLTPGSQFSGKIKVKDIKIPDEVDDMQDFHISLATEDLVKSLLPYRPSNGHKGTFGRLTSLCGSRAYMGAAALSTLAALRSGVGIVNLCTPSSVANALAASLFESTYTPLIEDSDGFLTALNLPKVLDCSKKSKALLVGCGIGVTNHTEKLVSELVKSVTCPIILDADGINCIAKHIDVLENTKATVILTPHLAELARLAQLPLEEVLKNPLDVAKDFVSKYNCTIIAKGAGSYVVTPKSTVLVNTGNTALSKGGSGDMLAGMVASFTAQGVTPKNACILGSYILGKTAESLCVKLSQRGILAREILSYIPVTLKSLED